MYTTYSFSDVSATIAHPSIGQVVASGEGIGTITVAYTNDRTTHDVSADGSVMVSKVKARNGTIALSIQQTSSLNKWLMKWFNYLEAAGVSQWALTTVTIKCTGMGETIVATGVSPQKQSDKTYQAQGQQLTWTLMAADIQEDAL